MIKLILMSIVGIICVIAAIILWRDDPKEKNSVDISPEELDNRLYTLEWMSCLNEYEKTIHLRNSREYRKTKKWLGKQIAFIKGEAKKII